MRSEFDAQLEIVRGRDNSAVDRVAVVRDRVEANRAKAEKSARQRLIVELIVLAGAAGLYIYLGV